MTTLIQIRSKGGITLPVEMRRRYNIAEGDVYTLLDLGDGALLLLPRVSSVARLGDQAARLLEEAGVQPEAVLEALDQEREDYYREHYAQATPLR